MADDKNIISLAEAADDSRMWSPEQMLEEAVKVARDEGWNKAIVLFLDDTTGRFDVDFLNAGLNTSQIVAVCEAMKMRALQMMGYVPDDVD